MGTFGSNGVEGRSKTHLFSAAYHGKRARRLADGTWEMPEAEVVREAAGTKFDMTYIWRKQADVAQWVAL